MFKDVLNALFHDPVTELYPGERPAASALLRGKLVWTPNGCTGCALCVKDCPANALELIVIDKAAKQFAMRYYADRCAYCGQCVASCRFNCIHLSSDVWELASDDRESFIIQYP